MSGYPKLVRQRTATTCGQCVLAMLMGVRREIAIRIVGHDGITSDADVQRVCGIYEDFAPGAPGFGVVAIQKHREPEGEREHWTLWWRDRCLDPAGLGERLWPVYKHLRIGWAE